MSSVRPAVVALRAGRERSLVRRHPWIFSGGIAGVEGRPGAGDTVLVEDDAGRALGWGAYSPESQIRVRMWSFDPTDTIDDAFVAGRVVRAAARREALLGSGTDAARLVFSEADGVPGVIADRYGDTVVVQLTTAGAEAWREVVADALFSLPGVRSVYERSDADVREREGLGPRVGVVRGGEPNPDLVAHEGPWRYVVDITGGHKTGFYLDQRHARAAIARLAPGRRVLNVFSYTGAFSVVAAGNGAMSVLSIDSSAPALEVARRNGAVNGVDVGELMEADAFTALRGLRDRARQYDLIALDPPKLANSERQLEKASRAYKDLNLLAIKLLAPGGMLLTWSCSGAMTAELFQKVVAGAALDAGRTVRIVDRLTQPGDHPVPLAFPEAEYLKGLVLEAE
ncbi:MAG: class I SAM-dependent rRNA methyltransferase [Acidimicrobiales bacterium]|nr:class I SAM-dependent rRNA methyltransferase [Acidimicrobiales bacterium]MCB9392687.1 class I SAM-dependent rRNA methyltransferase [Acidimicrobiaceae bacterium]